MHIKGLKQMKCKYCEAELEEGVIVCPTCGAAQEEMPAQQETAEVAEEIVVANEETPVEEAAVEAAEETVVEETVEDTVEAVAEDEITAEQPAKPKVKVWQIVVGAVCSVIVLAALAIVLLTAFGVDLRPKPNDIHKKAVYTVSDSQAARSGDKVVATVNGQELTNTMLQMFYRMSVVEYVNSNADYLSYMNLDLEKPFSEQPCYEDETLTWEQYFINSAIESWRNYQSVYMMAMEEGFVPSEELEHSLEELPATMEEMAKEEGFENGDALISDRFGKGCTVADYEAYCRMYYISAEYINVNPTAQELEDYYTANKDMFDQYSIGKESGNMVNVRHILICPEGGETNEETGEVTYTQAQWDACYDKAEGVYEDWKSGEATEESFAALANEKSEDGGSNTNGGLYAGITPDTNFVEPFLNWCMDASRQVGDTGIVKTVHGYHIMFFAHTQPQWEYYATTYFQSEYASKKIEAGREKWPMEVTYKNIALAALNFA